MRGAYEAYGLGLGEPVAISAEHGEGLADLYAALRAALPDQTLRLRNRRADDEHCDRAADPRRGDRASERRQVDPDQPIARRRTAADRSGSRHHARLRLRSISPGRAAVSDLRHRRHAPARAHRGQAREALRRRRAGGDPLRRGCRRADGCPGARSRSRTCVSPIWSSARAARSSSAINKWDLDGRPGAIGKLREEADHGCPRSKGVPVVALSGADRARGSTG